MVHNRVKRAKNTPYSPATWGIAGLHVSHYPPHLLISLRSHETTLLSLWLAFVTRTNSTKSSTSRTRHNLSHLPESTINHTTRNMIKPIRSKKDTNNNYQISNNCTTAPIRFHSFPPYLPPASSCQNYKTSTPESPNICNLDSDSCLCVSFCKHCPQSAVSSGSATAASLTFSDGNDVGELNFQGHTETDSRNMSKFLRLQETLANNLQSKHWQTCNTSESSTSAEAVCASLHW